MSLARTAAKEGTMDTQQAAYNKARALHGQAAHDNLATTPAPAYDACPRLLRRPPTPPTTKRTKTLPTTLAAYNDACAAYNNACADWSDEELNAWAAAYEAALDRGLSR